MLDMLLALAAQAAEPSFECNKAHSQIEHLICGSAPLSELDREEARVYRQILAAHPGDRARIVARQRDFLRGRNECGDSSLGSSLGPDRCVHDFYLQDIAELRRTWPVPDEAGGLSSTPLRYHCDGGFPDAWVTRFDLAPPEIYVSVHTTLDEAFILTGDGDRYVSQDDNMSNFDPATSRLQLGRRICTPAR